MIRRLLLLLALPAALSAGGVEVVRSLEGEAARPWARVETLRLEGRGLEPEPMLARAAQADPALLRALPEDSYQLLRRAPDYRGGDVWTARQDTVLLHLAPGWDRGGERTPVVLLHGTGDSANRAFAAPWDQATPEEIRWPGLMQELSGRGWPVFALTFLHPHGDNFAQAHQLARALERIRVLLGREDDPGFRVDLVAHSKGNLAARLYLQDAAEISSGHGWIPRFRGDVRRYVSVAGPHRGMDTPYRFLAWNDSCLLRRAAAPLGVEGRLRFGVWVDTRDWSLSGPCFRGDAQMLGDLVAAGVPFGPGSSTETAPWQAWFRNVSRNTLYRGGTTPLLASRGLAETRDRAGNVIARLNARGLPPEVEVVVLHGTSARLQWYLPDGTELETEDETAPGDGLLYAASAGYTAGLTRRGARLVAAGSLPLNHLDIARRRAAREWIVHALEAP